MADQHRRRGSGSRPLLAVVLLLVTGLASLGLAAPAAAHARFLSSDPAEGTVLTELPDTVVMTYSEEVAPQFVDTAVVAPGGEPVPTSAAADGTDVTVDLDAPGLADAADTAGTWQVVARVVSADGHPVEHTTSFVLEPTVPAAATPSAGVEPVPALTDEPLPATDAPDDGAADPSAQPAESSPPAAPTGGDPVAGLTEDLPGWAGALLVLAVLAAGASALVLALRRRPPGA